MLCIQGSIIIYFDMFCHWIFLFIIKDTECFLTVLCQNWRVACLQQYRYIIVITLSKSSFFLNFFHFLDFISSFHNNTGSMRIENNLCKIWPEMRSWLQYNSLCYFFQNNHMMSSICLYTDLCTMLFSSRLRCFYLKLVQVSIYHRRT